MNKKRYMMVVQFFSENKLAHNILYIIYKVLPYVMIVTYPVLLLVMLIRLGFVWEWMKLVLVPLSVLMLVTVMRMVVDAKRPYEVYGVHSVFHKQTEHQSMPSRHTASAYVIAMTFLKVNVPLGVIMLILASLIEASRVLAGSHFIRDVVIGAVIGIGTSVLCYFIF